MLNVEFSITENQGSVRGKLQSGGRNVCFTYPNYGNYGIGHEKQVICYFISKRGISFSERMTQKAKISMDFQPIETRTRFPAICGTQSIKMIKLGLLSQI